MNICLSGIFNVSLTESVFKNTCLKAEGSYNAGLIGGLGVSCEGGVKVLCDEACFMSKDSIKKHTILVECITPMFTWVDAM